MRSMTGFGRGSTKFSEGRVVLEIKSVNHRFLEIRSRAPRELVAGEALVERLLRSRLSRGYCLVNLWYEGNVGGTTEVDRGAIENHLKKLLKIAEEWDLCLTDLVPVLAGAPDLFSPPHPSDEDALKEAIESAFEVAISGLIEMREVEGRAMGEELAARISGLTESVDEIEELAEQWPDIALARIRDRLNALLNSVSGELDKQRIEAEAALLVDRADITEEITRLKSHLHQMSVLLDADEPVGRKAEFLIQEIGREVNTIGSKAAISEILPLVIKMKTELEKVREIVQNIE